MKLVAFGVAVVLLLTCNGFGGHAAPHVTSLYKIKSAGAALQQSVGDIWKDCSEFWIWIKKHETSYSIVWIINFALKL